MTRDRLFSQLPAIWKILDQRNLTVDEKGTLERFLGAWDSELDRTQGFVEELFVTKNVDQTRDRYLYVLGIMVGHRWNTTKTYRWNRNRIRDSIRRYSYKGTKENISDLVREHGGNWFKLLDMASLVGVYDRQASMPQNSHYFDSDFFHPGVFQLWLSDSIDIEHFLEDFEYIKPAGTKWIIRLCIADCHALIELVASGIPISEYGATYDYTYKLYNQEFGFYNHIPQVAWEPTVYTTLWSYIHSSFPNVYGQAFYNYTPQYPVNPVVYETIWADIKSGSTGNIYGDAFYNFEMQLPTQPIITYIDNYLGVANARLDMASLTFDWGNEEFTFDDEFIPEVYAPMQPLVEPIVLT